MTCSNYPSKLEPSSGSAEKNSLFDCVTKIDSQMGVCVGVPKLTAVMANCQLFPFYAELMSKVPFFEV